MSGSILIIARNNLHLTKNAVRTALAQDTPCDVMVIDNASTDGTGAWLKSKKDVIACIKPVQIALAACWNQGIAAFWGAGSQEVLVCNNDIELRPDTYRMLNGLGRDFVTCVSVASQDQVGYKGDRGYVELEDSIRPHPDFSCFMIRHNVTDKVGWFDEDYYPAYVEDCQYHVRMHRAGVEAVCVDLPFYHASAQTIKQCSAGEKLAIERGAANNKYRFWKVYGCFPGTPEYEKLFT